MTARLNRWKVFLLVIPFGFLYLSTLARNFSYDGVLYALDVEFGSIGQLFHPGHMLYSFLMRQLFDISHLFGYTGRALFLMQSANAWIGAIAVAVLAKTLADRFGVFRGILFAFFFGLSQVFWGEAIDPGCYALAGLAGVCLLNLLLRAPKENGWVVGFLHGFLILFHQLFILVIPALYVAVRWGAAPRVARSNRYLIGVLLGAGIPYALVALLFHPGPASERLLWFLIPAGTPSSMGVMDNVWWNWKILANIKPFLENLIQSFVAPVPLGIFTIGFLYFFIVVESFQQFKKRSSLSPELIVAWMWIIPMAFFLFFFFHYLRFDLLILPPILYLLAALSMKFRGREWGLISVVGLITLGAVNYTHAIVPRRTARDLQVRLEWVSEHVQPNDFLLFAGRGSHSLINVYAAYFLPQIPARSLYGFLLPQESQPTTDMEPLTAGFVATWQRGGHVWVEKDLLDPSAQTAAESEMKVSKGSVSAWFKKFATVREVPGPDGYCLVELTPAFQAR
jgi:hypothetical protein